MAARNDPAIWSGLFRLSPDSGQTLQAQIRQAIVAAILDRQIAASIAPALLPRARRPAWRGARHGGAGLPAARRPGFPGPPRAPRPISSIPKCWPPRRQPAPFGERSHSTIDWKALPAHRGDRSARGLPSRHNWIKAPYPLRLRQFDPALFPTAEWRECNRMALAVLEIRDWAGDRIDQDDPLLESSRSRPGSCPARHLRQSGRDHRHVWAPRTPSTCSRAC